LYGIKKRALIQMKINWKKVYPLLRSFLFSLPPERAHLVTLRLLSYLPTALFQTSQAQLDRNDTVQASFSLWNLTFPHRVGLAAGFDKNADYLNALEKLGLGFIEVGTVTPKPQKGNPQPRLFRLVDSQALINRMGFNNKGVDYVCERLKRRTTKAIIGVNIGKNADTPYDEAWQDYAYCYRRVYPFADYIVLNLSSPNTQALRSLQYGQDLEALLDRAKNWQANLHKEHGKKVPTLIKIAPDLSEEEVLFLAEQAIKFELEGIIACNTTISREHIADTECDLAKEKGGLSGLPLKPKAFSTFSILSKAIDQKIPLIACGGIFSREDALERLNLGASLIQVYTGLIFLGPELISQLQTLF